MYLLEYIEEVTEMLDAQQLEYYKLTGNKKQINLYLRKISDKEAINFSLLGNNDTCRIFGNKYFIVKPNGNALDLTIGLPISSKEKFILDYDRDYDWASFLEESITKNSSINIEELNIEGYINLADYFDLEGFTRHFAFSGDAKYNVIEIDNIVNQDGCYVGLFDSVNAKDIIIRNFNNPSNLDYMFSYSRIESIMLKGDKHNYGEKNSGVESCRCMFKDAEIGTLILDFAAPYMFTLLHDMFLDSSIERICIYGRERYENLKKYINYLPMKYFGGELTLL